MPSPFRSLGRSCASRWAGIFWCTAGARSRAGLRLISVASSEQGFDPALPWIWGALIIEFVGGIALILGLFTRFFAAAAAVEMLVITVLYWKAGFSWLNCGYEYTLLWGLICFAIALRGGGPYSLDRRIGIEL